MSKKKQTYYDRKKAEAVKNFVPADPRCSECYYWRYLGGIGDESVMCCNFALYEGKLRERISSTECGSFKPSKGTKKKSNYQSVPMSQWGCNGLGVVRKVER